MDFKIRTTKTKTGKTAVQVINYVKRKVNILKHIGSGKNKNEIQDLKGQAVNWINSEINRTGLFKNNQDLFFKNYQDSKKYYGRKNTEQNYQRNSDQ